MSQTEVKAALEQTIGAIQSDPATAQATFTARTAWKHDTLCEVQVRKHPPMMVDEPAELGGSDAAMNPVELVLGALGTCQEIMYAAYAAVGEIPLDSVKIRVRGDLDLHGLFGLDEDVPAGYSRIEFNAEIESTADQETIGKLVEAVNKHCPVLDTLTRAIPVSNTATLNGRALEPAAQPA